MTMQHHMKDCQPGRIRSELSLPVLAAVLAACAGQLARPAPATASFAQGRATPASAVLFSGTQTGAPKIYVMDADGTNVRQLTTGPAADETPSYAPGGERFVWVRKVPGADGGAIWTALADGTTPVQLTRTSLRAANPEYSPDGTEIAFDAFVASEGLRRVFVMNADGSAITQITFGQGDFIDPSWSPDGEDLVMSNDRVGDGSWGIVTVSAMGGPVVRRVDCAVAPGCGEPAYSPVDKNRIVFTDFSKNRLMMIDDVNPVYDFVGPQPNIGRPAWSADGRRVLYHSELLGTEDLYAAYAADPADAADTSEPAPFARLTSLGGSERAPAPSP